VSGAVLGSPVVPQRDPPSHVRLECPEAVDDRVVDRLQGGEAVAAGGEVRPGFGGVVVDRGEQPHPAVLGGVGHGGIGAPHHVRRVRHDRAVMRAGFAPPTGALGGEQVMGSHQPQDPLSAHPHPVFSSEPGVDLAVALPGERRVVKHLADQGEQLLVVDRTGRAGTSQRDHVVTGVPGAAGVDGGAGRVEHRAHRGERALSSMAIVAASSAGSEAPFFRRRPAGSRSRGSAPRPCVRPV
jgi:hypothetical protein